MANEGNFTEYTTRVFTEGSLRGMVTVDNRDLAYSLVAISKDGRTLGGSQHNSKLTDEQESELRKELDNVAKSMIKVNELLKSNKHE